MSSVLNNSDIVNNVALIVSCVVAIFIPFELFILSYAILGPLHYLTEINWLRTKDYFIRIKTHWMWLLIAAALIISIIPILSVFKGDYFLDNRNFFEGFYIFSNYVLVFSILLGLSFGLIQSSKSLIWFLPLLLMLTFSIGYFFKYVSLFVIMLVPTLIHVYIFTLIFVITGFLKNHSKQSLLTVVLMITVLVVIIYLPLKPTQIEISTWALQTFSNSGFSGFNQYLNDLFQLNGNENYSPLSVAGYKLQIFIAFAYTYHYLNWFTKTTVIGWKKVLTKKTSLLIFTIWSLAVALYFYNYKMGFAALFLLSFTHVLFELPLNMQAIKMLFNPKVFRG